MTRQARYFLAAALFAATAGLAIALVGDKDQGTSASEDTPVALPPSGKAFGFNESPEVEGVEQAELESLSTLAGANARRFPLDWRQVEPDRDVWNEGGWAYYKRTYDAILAASMTPVIDFGFAPPWARDPGAAQACSDFFACRYPPARAMIDEWREFASEVARRFPQAVLEVWNEPNLAIFWRPAPDPERFAELQAVAFDAIKAVNPDSIVLAGGLAANGPPDSRIAPAVAPDMPLRDFLERAYGASPSIRGKMDALSFHPYPYGPDLEDGSFFAKTFDDVRATMAAYDDARPLWVTETGIASTGSYAVDEAQQAEVLVALVGRLASMPDVDGILLHRLLPPPEEAAGSTEHGYAILRTAQLAFAPKPAYCAIVALAGESYDGCPTTDR